MRRTIRAMIEGFGVVLAAFVVLVTAVAAGVSLAIVGVATGAVIVLFIAPRWLRLLDPGIRLRRANLTISVNGHKSEVAND